MTQRPDLFWGLIASMYMGNLIAVMLVLARILLGFAVGRHIARPGHQVGEAGQPHRRGQPP